MLRAGEECGCTSTPGANVIYGLGYMQFGAGNQPGELVGNRDRMGGISSPAEDECRLRDTPDLGTIRNVRAPHSPQEDWQHVELDIR